MPRREGVTLMEMIVVLIIVGIISAVAAANYLSPVEQGRALTARDNLLAIYTAQQNYNNNNGQYCFDTTSASSACTSISANCADSLAAINCNLSLSIPDDGTYTYTCDNTPRCTATRTSTAATMVITLNTPVNLKGAGTLNPQCNLTASWCP
ncbi:MAG: prepilin-type N-terminal cleavage/methylation domain-containing protein [Candidatus Omnitrophica bacterium]|nr:prepilin-type N-terminal cleavage/methylation domain-containing protein [Candidatus Omnitrophota bacterium]MDE2223026.1 prepilin-type N-terminal cleavage/methylation domain-containing protein [Candidatus Omnitrophota bacterium]